MPAFIQCSLSHSALPTAPSKRNKNESKVQMLFSLSEGFPPSPSISLQALFSLPMEISVWEEGESRDVAKVASPAQGLALLLSPPAEMG